LRKSDKYLLPNLLTNKQTNADENITSLAEVITEEDFYRLSNFHD